MFKKILVLSPHTDDGEIAAGATIAKFIEEGKELFYVVFSTCEKSVPKDFPKNILKQEVKKATKVLGIPSNNLILFNYEVRDFPSFRQRILDDMIELNNKIKPDLVLVPSSSDTHQDHKTIYEEALRAFKKSSTIWGYEHPWNNLHFTTDIFVKLDEEHIKVKIAALAKYKSQHRNSYFKPDYIKALAYTRGVQIDVEYAETFELIRELFR